VHLAQAAELMQEGEAGAGLPALERASANGQLVEDEQ